MENHGTQWLTYTNTLAFDEISLSDSQPGAVPVRDPDFNDDLIVNAASLACMKTHFFGMVADADLKGDLRVNAAALAQLKAFFFLPSGPSRCGAP